MQLLNPANLPAQHTLGLKPDGRELLVVAVKATYLFPPSDSPPETLAQLATPDQQVPLVMADTFTGEPGLSAPIYESDFAYHKPKCDIILHGSAYAPQAVPDVRIPVTLEVGAMKKSFDVLGERIWKKSLFGLTTPAPQRAIVIPFSYDTAFGGTEYDDPKKRRACITNPVGRGFARGRDIYFGKPFPNTCETDKLITSPSGKHRPMSFGPIGRSWEPRLKYTGTYDENWMKNVRPFLPDDFDERYFQCAPPDQQTDYLKGGERITLRNLTSQNLTTFTLPPLDMPVAFYPKGGDETETHATADTLCIEPDLRRLTVTWRASYPLVNDISDIALAIVGRMSAGWYHARKLGKTWYPSLAELAASRNGSRNKKEIQEVETAA
jgi:hypothetical protein